MAVDVRKLKEEAVEFTRNGKFEKAIAIFKTLVLADKKEVTHAVKIAELHVKLKQNDKAVQWYETAAKKYAEQGHLPKAIAMAKLILQLDPQHAATQSMLSDLYAKKEVGSTPNPLLQMPQVTVPAAAPLPAAKMAQAVELIAGKEAFQTAPTHGFEGESAFEAEEDELVSDVVEDDDEKSFDLQNLGGEPAPVVDTFDEEDVTIEISDDDLRAEIVAVDPRLLEHLPRVPLFSDLNPEEFQRIIQRIEIREYEDNEYIVSEGDLGDSFFVITQGNAIVVKEDYAGLTVQLARLPEGAFFGEFAYLADTHRTASVVAEGTVSVLELARESMDALTEEHPRLKTVLQEFYRDRVLSTILAISPLFEPFSAEEKQSIIRQFRLIQVPAGSVLIEQGTDGDGLYVILNGEVRVNKTDVDAEEVQLGELRAGEFFGEMSLLNNAKTTATVIATKNTSLFKLPAKEFAELAVFYPALLGVLQSFAVERRMRNQTLDAGFGESGLV